MVTAALIWIIAASLVVVGIIGVVVPAIPGALLLYGGLFIGAWAEDFTYVPSRKAGTEAGRRWRPRSG